MFKAILSKIKENAQLIWYRQEENCLLCSQPSSAIICSKCQEEYFQPEVRRCESCGKLLEATRIYCYDCQRGQGPRGLKKVTSLGYYGGAWKEFIQKIKFEGQPYLLIPLAEHFIPWVIEHLPVPDSIVPVPMHSNRLAQRGFNQAEVLASIISRKLGISYREILVREIDTVPQTTLGRKERIRNLQGVFAIKPGSVADSKVVWLVDDVVTTGTTLGECAEILQTSGVQEVYGFCLGAGKENETGY
jgi:competence protein ComFC